MLTYFSLHEVIRKKEYSKKMINNPLELDNIIFDSNHPKNLTSSYYRISQKKH